MGPVLTVTFGDGDLAEQLYQLKICALRNHDTPALWRLTSDLLDALAKSIESKTNSRWPHGWMSDSRLFDVPLDFVHAMPHLLCEEYVIYPYTVPRPRVLLAS